jgi:glycosyltransferase involved in cell wall biosynthesis
VVKNTIIRISTLSVVIPTYNGASWLSKTINKVEEAIVEANLEDYEILVINDGSTDDTVETVLNIAKQTGLPIRLVTQENGGRFMARKTGAIEARYEHLLFVDTRVYIGKKSLKYILDKQSMDKSRTVWCAHVRSESKGNIYARFWEAIAYVAWRNYFKNPRDISYGIEGFDSYPKGTTCFFIKKKTLIEANNWFIKNTKDLKTSNDDTLLIRHIAESNNINVSPKYWCLYHARSSMKQYTKHVFHRGKVFVDGFLRRDGNRFFYPLIGFLAISFAVVASVAVKPTLLLVLAPAIVVGWLIELVAILLLRVPLRDGLSLFVLSPVFAIFYGAGIWHAFIKIFIVSNLRKQRY